MMAAMALRNDPFILIRCPWHDFHAVVPSPASPSAHHVKSGHLKVDGMAIRRPVRCDSWHASFHRRDHQMKVTMLRSGSRCSKHLPSGFHLERRPAAAPLGDWLAFLVSQELAHSGIGNRVRFREKSFRSTIGKELALELETVAGKSGSQARRRAET